MTGDVLEPRVEVEDGGITISFQVMPEQTTANCQGNNEVAYEVVLPEPLGNRELIDGQCAPGAEASHTSFCRPSGVRHAPG